VKEDHLLECETVILQEFTNFPLRNVGKLLPDYTASNPTSHRRENNKSHSETKQTKQIGTAVSKCPVVISTGTSTTLSEDPCGHSSSL
jgi:hypothetical protein